MSIFKEVEITQDLVDGLKQRLQGQEKIIPFGTDRNFSLLVCYILWREIGGPNDQLARFVRTDQGGKVAHPAELRAQVGVLEGQDCVRIASKNDSALSLSLPHLGELISSRDGSLLIFPSHIAEGIRLQGLTPVFVKEWIERVLFSQFAPHAESYRDQLWVLRNNEAMLYAQIVADGQVIFQEMHDLVAHIAGIQATGYGFASRAANRINQKLRAYFGPTGRGNLPSHLLPYLMGLVLDALTQMPFYQSEVRAFVIDELILAMDQLGIDPRSSLVLTRFPKGIDAVIEVMRDTHGYSVERLRVEIHRLVEECRKLSSPFYSSMSA